MLLASGLNHHTAPLSVRERIYFAPKDLSPVLQQLKQTLSIEELVILSTCNRTEIYTAANDILPIWVQLCQLANVDSQHIMPHLFQHTETQAIRHLLRVASGVDSVALGEPQIVGQLKQAFVTAEQIGMVGRTFKFIQQYLFTASKKVRTETGIHRLPVSIAYAAVQLARKIFSHLNQTKVLLIGAGETIALTLKHLQEQHVKQTIIANRTRENALALEYLQPNHRIVDLHQIPEIIHEVDIVISAVQADLPLIGKGLIEGMMRERRQPLLLIDLAVPRNIEAQISHLDDVYLYSIDDLKNITTENWQQRVKAAEDAEILIEQEVKNFVRQQKARQLIPDLVAFRAQHQAITSEELQRALQQLHTQKTPEQVLTEFAHRLTQKWLHQPTKQFMQQLLEVADETHR